MSPPLIQSYKIEYAQQLHGANTFNAVCVVCVCFYECYISYARAVDVNYCTYAFLLLLDLYVLYRYRYLQQDGDVGSNPSQKPQCRANQD